MRSIAFPITALASVLLLVPNAAFAQITVHTTLAAFVAATSARATDTFNDLAIASIASPLNRTTGAYSYRAAATGGVFFPAGTASDTWLAANAASDVVTLSNFSSAVRAVGGNFFGADIFGAFVGNATIVVTATSGGITSTQTLTNPTLTSFLGFTSVSALTSISISATQSGNGSFVWAASNDLTLGELAVNVVPEPAAVLLTAAGVLILAGAAARRRLLQSDGFTAVTSSV